MNSPESSAAASQRKAPHRGTFAGVALLVVIFACSRYAVTHFRRPGSMSVIEAQAMDMSVMKAPVGAVPVSVAIARPGTLAPSVTYTGSVVPYSDEAIVARVAGRIVDLPAYPGDRVRAGELLVRLDDAELDARKQEAGFAVEAATHDAASATSDVERANDVQQQAAAEADRYAGMADEATQNLAAAAAAVQSAIAAQGVAEHAVTQAEHEAHAAAGERDRDASELDAMRSDVDEAASARDDSLEAVQQAQSRVPQAQAELDDALAEASFEASKAQRSATLWKQGALSQEEYQQDSSSASSATARAQAARAKVNEAQSAVRSAQAQARQAEARLAATRARLRAAQAGVAQGEAEAQAAIEKVAQMRLAVQQARLAVLQSRDQSSAEAAKVDQAEAGSRGSQAMARAAAAEFAKASHETGHATATYGQANAQLQEAEIVRGYTQIRASSDGVVTQRLVAPGVLVEPGTVILKVAEIDRVRLQASVVQGDLATIKVGMPVTVHAGADSANELHTTVSAVFPATDTTSRTGLVEAVVTDNDLRWRPGQYVTMDIATGPTTSGVVVPSSAVVNQPEASNEVQSLNQAPAVWLLEEVKTNSPTIYTCTMHPWVRSTKPGPCPICKMPMTPLSAKGRWRARLALVRVGAVNGDETTILSGVKTGAQVIETGYEDLHDGDAVQPETDETASQTATAESALESSTAGRVVANPAAGTVVKIIVSGQGFDPSSISAAAGAPLHLDFLRTTDLTCATAVTFPSLGIHKSLPLNKEVDVSFTPARAGRVNFVCGMGMLRGVVLVRSKAVTP